LRRLLGADLEDAGRARSLVKPCAMLDARRLLLAYIAAGNRDTSPL
jgi:hypothetical protein